MTFNEKVIEILQQRSFEFRDGATKMQIIEASDFDQIAMDILELLVKEYGLEVEEKTP